MRTNQPAGLFSIFLLVCFLSKSIGWTKVRAPARGRVTLGFTGFPLGSAAGLLLQAPPGAALLLQKCRLITTAQLEFQLSGPGVLVTLQKGPPFTLEGSAYQNSPFSGPQHRLCGGIPSPCDPEQEDLAPKPVCSSVKRRKYAAWERSVRTERSQADAVLGRSVTSEDSVNYCHRSYKVRRSFPT